MSKQRVAVLSFVVLIAAMLVPGAAAAQVSDCEWCYPCFWPQEWEWDQCEWVPQGGFKGCSDLGCGEICTQSWEECPEEPLVEADRLRTTQFLALAVHGGNAVQEEIVGGVEVVLTGIVSPSVFPDMSSTELLAYFEEKRGSCRTRSILGAASAIVEAIAGVDVQRVHDAVEYIAHPPWEASSEAIGAAASPTGGRDR